MSWFNPDIPNPVAGGSPGALQFGGEGQSPLYCNCSTGSRRTRTTGDRELGFAYRVGDKTVIRAGYGIMYTRHGAVGGRGGAREGTGKARLHRGAGFPVRRHVQSGVRLGRWRARLPEASVLSMPTLNTGFTTERPTGGSVAYDNPEEAARPPRYQNWNFSIQRAITPSRTLTAGYVGGNGKLLRGGGLGIWSSQIHPRYLALGNLLDVASQCEPRSPRRARSFRISVCPMRISAAPSHRCCDRSRSTRRQRRFRESGQLELQLPADHAATRECPPG